VTNADETLRAGDRFLFRLAVEPQGWGLAGFAGDFDITDRLVPAKAERKAGGSFGGIAAG
jgi:hypothetical protein